MSERLAELAKRKEQALHAGSERAVERQHAKGKMLARERIEYLLDHPEAARRMGAEGQRFVLTHASLERSARGFVEAVLAAERVPAPPVEAAAYAPTGASGGPGRTGEAAP